MAATSACAVVFLVAFGIPVVTLGAWSLEPGLARVRPLWEPAATSVMLGASAALVATAIAMLLAYARRLSPEATVGPAVTAASLGYAMPGAVVAVGVLAVATRLDVFAEGLAVRLDAALPPLLAGSVLGLLVAYLVRFIAVALQPAEAGLARIPRPLDEAAASLGARPLRVARAIHLPLLSAPLAGALLLVFMDVIKELPATMLMRPRGWDTLAVEVWQLTTESLWREAALPSLAIVAASLPAAVVIIRSSGLARWQQ